MRTSPTQHQASDEFSAAPRGLRRWAGAMRRRLGRIVQSGQPPRWCLQDAFDFCERELSRCSVESQLIRDVAELFAQPQLLKGLNRPSEEVTATETNTAETPLLELANMATEAFRQHAKNTERRTWANEAMRHLRRSQQPSGAVGDTETTLAFLRAGYWQAKAAFSNDAWEFPAEIADDDGRAVAVREWRRTLPPGARLLDAGCGKGRYLKQIQRERGDLQLVGVDVAEQALRQLPKSVEGRAGHLLKLPADSAEFDAVLCVEALEHALLPRQAALELCRVLRPGGSLLVIDKDRRHQARSQTQPWEVWFSPADFTALLQPACELVACDQLRHQATIRKSVFLAAKAVRRADD